MAGDGEDGGERVRLFVGQVPRSMAEEDILAVVRAAARADDATVIRDRATGASRGCCFVVCSSREEADKAIAAYHNKCTLPGASRAMQVKYADGELERLAAEQKLFIGMLPRDVKENEVSALFSQYGNIRQLKILRSPQKTRKAAACAILEFGSKEHARAAIEAFNGTRVVFNGSSATLVVKLADTEKEKQARKAQKAQAQPSKPLRFDLFPQLLSIFGAPQMSYLPPYNVFDYKTEGTTDPELKDLMKMTNDKLEMLVTELKSVVNLLENRVTYNDPIQPIQHSLLPVEHDEKQYKPNECDSKTLEVPGDYGHTKNPLASYNTMYPHVNQGNLLQGLNTNIFPGTDPKISNLIQSAGYIQPHFPDLSGLHYPVSYAGALVGDTPQYFSDGKVNIPNIHSNHASSVIVRSDGPVSQPFLPPVSVPRTRAPNHPPFLPPPPSPIYQQILAVGTETGGRNGQQQASDDEGSMAEPPRSGILAPRSVVGEGGGGVLLSTSISGEDGGGDYAAAPRAPRPARERGEAEQPWLSPPGSTANSGAAAAYGLEAVGALGFTVRSLLHGYDQPQLSQHF